MLHSELGNCVQSKDQYMTKNWYTNLAQLIKINKFEFLLDVESLHGLILTVSVNNCFLLTVYLIWVAFSFTSGTCSFPSGLII